MEVEKRVEEELFCLKFELDALSEVAIRNHAERWIYKIMYPAIEEEHMARYTFALERCAGKSVLDIAGGCGYGAFFLASKGNPKTVDSVEIDKASVRYANHRYHHPAVNRYVDNAETFCKPDFYDLIISFETVEHLDDPTSFLKNMCTSLKKDGRFIISTPITRVTSKTISNPYHKIEWSFADFQTLISRHFDIEETYIQNLYLKHSKWNIFKRISNKLATLRKEVLNPKGIFPFNSSTKIENIEAGYQVLICKKR